MILAIDIGNTTIGVAAAVFQDGSCELRHTGKLETNRFWSNREYADSLNKLLERWQTGREAFRGAVISSVVPPVLSAMVDAVRAALGCEPVVITCDSDLGIQIAVDYPRQVGCDRLVDSAWAAAAYPLPAVTVDLGTASTFNVITADRVFCGGVIAAGMLTGLQALTSHTAQLPAVELRVPEHVIGKNTAQCMLSGAVMGTAALVDGIVTGIEAELGQSVTLLITGGGGKFTQSLIRHPHVYDPDFILKGLAYLFERNR